MRAAEPASKALSDSALRRSFTTLRRFVISSPTLAVPKVVPPPPEAVPVAGDVLDESASMKAKRVSDRVCFQSCRQQRGSIYASVDQTYEGTEPLLIPFGLKGNDEECAVLGSILPTIHEDVSKTFPAKKASLHEYPKLSEDAVVVQETCNNEIFVTGGFVVDNRIENHDYLLAGSIPRYVNLEPSLAMDWLEISWDDL